MELPRATDRLRLSRATVRIETIALALIAFMLALRSVACSGGGDDEPVIDPGDDGNYAPVLDPAAFTSEITNPYLPLRAGSSWTYESEDGSELIEIEVLHETRTVMGVEARVVRERAYEDGELVEDTLDWFAQDARGNVWYFGEESKDIQDGEVVSTEGSWEAGVEGAQPGIVMPADPVPGDAYRQEFYPGEAEDMAEVLRLDGSQETPAGTFDDLLVTREWTPLEPGVVEEKYYATGVGLVAEQKVRGDSGSVLLTAFTPAN
jgi:hypothetical protein